MLPDDHQVKRVIVTCHHNVTIKINNLTLHRGILKWTIMTLVFFHAAICRFFYFFINNVT